MDRTEQRRASRHQYKSLGQIVFAGETLDFISFDISENGILIEILPGDFLVSLEDFENALRDNYIAEFFVRELKFTGEAEVVRVYAQAEHQTIMLAMTFRDVIHNAERMWHKRKYYRKRKGAAGILIVQEDRKILFETLDISVGGAMLRLLNAPEESQSIQGIIALDRVASMLQKGQVVKILIKDFNLKAITEIVWLRPEEEFLLGIKFLQMDNKLLNANQVNVEDDKG